MSPTPTKKFLVALKVKNLPKNVEYFESSLVGQDWIFKKMHGVHPFIKIKCLRCRTDLIHRALCSSDLGECFTYPEHVPNSYKKFLVALKVKNLLKHIEYSESSLVGQDWIFKKMHGVHPIIKIKCLRCRTVFIQSALCFSDLGECFTYPEHVPNSYKTFFSGSQSQKPPKTHRIF